MNILRVQKALCFFICSVFIYSTQAQSFRTAQQIAAEMKIGWNIGNTMEALYEYNGTIVAGETAWGNPAITQTLINSVKSAGFNTIRIPVAWDVHATNSVIDASWIARVKQVVDYCIHNDLFVILNIHWDKGWLEENCNPATQNSVNAKQQQYWTQIANYFKNYDDRLLFASANEPNVDNATQMAVLLSYHQTFINAVRATGGNNSERILVVQGPRTDIEATDELMNQMPIDVVTGRMMAEVHFYPYQFCLMDADQGWGNQFYYWGACNHSTSDVAHNPTWGEEAWVDEMFQRMKTKFVNNGIPVILGEFGVKQRTNLSGAAFNLHEKSREYFLKYVTKSALQHGIIPVYWCAGLKELFDRNTGAVLDQNVLHALMAGAYSSGTSVNCDANDCLGVSKGHAYINECGDCVLGAVPCVSNLPPIVSITSPASSASFPEGSSITIRAQASDSDGNIVKVEFYNGSVKIGERTSAPYSFTWTNVQAGTYVLTAVATDNGGLSTTSAQVSISVLRVDCNGVSGGTAFVDKCGNCVGGNTGKTECPQVKAQAEDVSCSFDGVVESNNAGFEGTGFINGDNAANTTITFRIIAQETASFVVGIQYANGGAEDRPCKILVNGVEQIASLSMPVTTWTNYQSVETSLMLESGVNEITLVALASSGFANIDYYYVYGDALFGPCDVTQTISLSQGWNLISVSVLCADAACSIATIFNNLDVEIVKNADGFWKSNIADEYNSLQYIEPQKGYLVYMNTAATLEITGSLSLETWNSSPSLQNGWNMIGYPGTGEDSFSPIPFSHYFNATNCQHIKNFDGHWTPNGATNSITHFEQGKGYFILK